MRRPRFAHPEWFSRRAPSSATSRSLTSLIRPGHSISPPRSRQRKSSNKDVRAFAEDMERDHKAVNEKALAW